MDVFLSRMFLFTLLWFSNYGSAQGSAESEIGNYVDTESTRALFGSGKTFGEVSGVVSSRQNPGLIWAHHDNSFGPQIIGFRLDTDDNKLSEVARISLNAISRWKLKDPEDIGLGICPPALRERWGQNKQCLYLAVIGSYADSHFIHAFIEPEIEPESSAKKKQKIVPSKDQVSSYQISFNSADAEAFVVNPNGDSFWVIDKSEAIVFYEGTFNSDRFQRLIKLPKMIKRKDIGSITGADLDPTGQRLLLLSYDGVYESELLEPGDLKTLQEPSDNLFDINHWYPTSSEESVGWLLSPDGNQKGILVIPEGYGTLAWLSVNGGG